MEHRRLKPVGPRTSPAGKVTLGIVLLVLLFGAGSIAGFVIEFQWWKEMGQVDTWFDMLGYGLAPVTVATLLSFIVLFMAHARGMKFAGASLKESPTYAKLSAVGLLALSYFVAAGSFDNWTAVRFIGSRGLTGEALAWHDPVFAFPLSFYLFDLPFYSELRGFLFA